MNPNFEQDNGNDQGQQPADNEMNESDMTFSTADYPELEGIKNGSTKLTCEGVANDNGDGTISFKVSPESCQFETEGQADRSMREMSQQDSQQPAPSTSGEDF